METKTKKIVKAALLAALACVATMIIRIPSPRGYINLGDSIVLLAGWILSPLYGFMAAAVGSALADLLSGYGLYAPVTFIIKGIMALVAYVMLKVCGGRIGNLLSKIVGGVFAELIMILGYFLFEGVYYGSFYTAAVNIPFNVIQGAVGMAVGIVLVGVFEKNRIMM